jgi:sec-independent protein translocase protein TatB
MQLFNIGPVEFLLILIVMFILLGPEGMIRTARQIGSWIRQIIRSPIWKDVMGYSQEIRELPQKIVRETGLDEDLAEIRKTTQAASDEVKQSMQDANQEVKKSLDEVGSVKVDVDVTPSINPYPQLDHQSDQHQQPVPDQQPVISNVLPQAQTADKYSSSSEDEETE